MRSYRASALCRGCLPAEAAYGIFFVGVSLENLVQPYDVQHVLHALSGPQQLQAAANIARACITRDKFADSRRTVHIGDLSEVQNDIALARLQEVGDSCTNHACSRTDCET